MAKKVHHEEHADETWLIPYADMLTLLLALFIVLFASSQIDQKKLDQMAAAFGVAFSGPSVFDRDSAVETIREEGNQHQYQNPPGMIDPELAANLAYNRETDELLNVKRQMDAYIVSNGLETHLSTELSEEGLTIRITETALFSSGSATLNEDSRHLAVQIAEMIIPITQPVTISGHTDNLPINTRDFPSNWELSTSRAVNFMRLILTVGSENQEEPLSPQRFRAIGYGEYHPIATNDTFEGRAANRRVEVLIMRNHTR